MINQSDNILTLVYQISQALVCLNETWHEKADFEQFYAQLGQMVGNTSTTISPVSISYSASGGARQREVPQFSDGFYTLKEPTGQNLLTSTIEIKPSTQQSIANQFRKQGIVTLERWKNLMPRWALRVLVSPISATVGEGYQTCALVLMMTISICYSAIMAIRCDIQQEKMEEHELLGGQESMMTGSNNIVLMLLPLAQFSIHLALLRQIKTVRVVKLTQQKSYLASQYDKTCIGVVTWLSFLTLLLLLSGGGIKQQGDDDVYHQKSFYSLLTMLKSKGSNQICSGYLACLTVIRFLCQTMYSLSSASGAANSQQSPLNNPGLNFAASQEQSQELHRRLESQILGRALHQVMITDSSTHQSAYGLFQLNHNNKDADTTKIVLESSHLHLITKNRPFSDLVLSSTSQVASSDIEQEFARIQGKIRRHVESPEVKIKSIAQHAEDLIQEAKKLQEDLEQFSSKENQLNETPNYKAVFHKVRDRLEVTIQEVPEKENLADRSLRCLPSMNTFDQKDHSTPPKLIVKIILIDLTGVFLIKLRTQNESKRDVSQTIIRGLRLSKTGVEKKLRSKMSNSFDESAFAARKSINKRKQFQFKIINLDTNNHDSNRSHSSFISRQLNANRIINLKQPKPPALLSHRHKEAKREKSAGKFVRLVSPRQTSSQSPKSNQTQTLMSKSGTQQLSSDGLDRNETAGDKEILSESSPQYRDEQAFFTQKNQNTLSISNTIGVGNPVRNTHVNNEKIVHQEDNKSSDDKYFTSPIQQTESGEVAGRKRNLSQIQSTFTKNVVVQPGQVKSFQPQITVDSAASFQTPSSGQASLRGSNAHVIDFSFQPVAAAADDQSSSNVAPRYQQFHYTSLMGEQSHQPPETSQLLTTEEEHNMQQMKRMQSHLIKYNFVEAENQHQQQQSQIITSQQKHTSMSSRKRQQRIFNDSGTLLSKHKSRNDEYSSLKSQSSSKNIFVFKVIHDLRHPVEAQRNAMNQLLSDLEKLNHVFFNHFSHGTQKYIVREKVHFALKQLDKITSKKNSSSHQHSATLDDKSAKIDSDSQLISFEDNHEISSRSQSIQLAKQNKQIKAMINLPNNENIDALLGAQQVNYKNRGQRVRRSQSISKINRKESKQVQQKRMKSCVDSYSFGGKNQYEHSLNESKYSKNSQDSKHQHQSQQDSSLDKKYEDEELLLADQPQIPDRVDFSKSDWHQEGEDELEEKKQQFLSSIDSMQRQIITIQNDSVEEVVREQVEEEEKQQQEVLLDKSQSNQQNLLADMRGKSKNPITISVEVQEFQSKSSSLYKNEKLSSSLSGEESPNNCYLQKVEDNLYINDSDKNNRDGESSNINSNNDASASASASASDSAVRGNNKDNDNQQSSQRRACPAEQHRIIIEEGKSDGRPQDGDSNPNNVSELDDSNTSECAQPIHLPKQTEHNQKPKMDRVAIVSDLNAQAQLESIKDRTALERHQAQPMRTVHQPGSLAAERLLAESIIGHQSGLNRLLQRHHLHQQNSNTEEEKVKEDKVQKAAPADGSEQEGNGGGDDSPAVRVIAKNDDRMLIKVERQQQTPQIGSVINQIEYVSNDLKREFSLLRRQHRGHHRKKSRIDSIQYKNSSSLLKNQRSQSAENVDSQKLQKNELSHNNKISKRFRSRDKNDIQLGESGNSSEDKSNSSQLSNTDRKLPSNNNTIDHIKSCKRCEKRERNNHMQNIVDLCKSEEMRADDTKKLIKVILIERRLLIRLTEMSFKKLIKYRETVQDLQMSSNMTEILLKDLVDFAQIQSGTFHLNKDYFDLMDLVRNSLKTLKWNADKREVNLYGPVLKQDEDAMFLRQFHGDSLRYIQIINNFVSNSIKFTPKLGTVQVVIKVKSLRANNQQARLQILALHNNNNNNIQLGLNQQQHQQQQQYSEPPQRQPIKRLSGNLCKRKLTEVDEKGSDQENSRGSLEIVTKRNSDGNLILHSNRQQQQQQKYAPFEKNFAGGGEEELKQGKNQDTNGSQVVVAVDQVSEKQQQLLIHSNRENNRNNLSSEEEESIELKMVIDLVFKDNGCGINKDQLKNLFREFGKLKETRDINKTGVGLGLSICRDLVQKFEGTVDVKSEEGTGTEFIVSIPTKCKVNPKHLPKHRMEKILNHFARVKQNQTVVIHQRKSKKQFNRSSSNHRFFSHGQVKKIDSMSNCKRQIMVDKQQSNDNFRFKLNLKNRLQNYLKLSESQQNLNNNCNDDSSNPSNSMMSPMNSQLGGIQMRAMQGSSPRVGTHQQTGQDKRNHHLLNAQNKSNQRCLLANDQDFLLTIFGYSLQKHFNEIYKAVDGEKALQAVKGNPIDHFDLIILDVNMPIMDGKEACTKILEHFQSVIDIAKREKRAGQRLERGFAANLKHSVQSMKLSEIEEVEESGQNSQSSQTIKLPNIYALTSDLDQRLKAQLKQIGFKNVYQELNEVQLREIFVESKLVFNDRVNSEEDISMKDDDSSSSDCDDDSYDEEYGQQESYPPQGDSSQDEDYDEGNDSATPYFQEGEACSGGSGSGEQADRDDVFDRLQDQQDLNSLVQFQ